MKDNGETGQKRSRSGAIAMSAISPSTCPTQLRYVMHGNIQRPNVTDILGTSRELLYEANMAASNIGDIQHAQVPNFQMPQPPQTLTNTTSVNNAQTTQGPGQTYIHQSYSDQYNGQFNQQVYRPVSHAPNPSNEATSNIPMWANGLCQQMTYIQTLLDGHAKQWQTVENSISMQNSKLNNMEKQLLEISNIKQELVRTNTKVYQVENEIKKLHTKITDYDDTITYYSDAYDDITSNNTDTEARLRDMESRLQNLEMKFESLEQNMVDTNDKLTDVRWRSMRENLLFFGIPEAGNVGEREDCESKITEFLKNEMNIEKDIPLDRAHRLGRFNPRHARPRPIVVKFTYFKDRELARLSASQLGGSTYGISEQFPAEIEDKRRPLYSVARKARENQNNKVKMVRDKLYINGELYVPRKQNDSENKREYGQNEYRPKIYTHNIDRAATGSQDRATVQRSRTFTRRISPTDRNECTTKQSVETSNRFASLGETTPSALQSSRSSRGGKKKASSPLEEEAATKKQYISAPSPVYVREASFSEDSQNNQTQTNTQQSPSILQHNTVINYQELVTPPPSSKMTLDPSPTITMPAAMQTGSARDDDLPRAIDRNSHSQDNAV